MHDRGYFRWLKRHFLTDSMGNPDGYSCLLEQMFRKEYYTVVRNDENRAGDGVYLRDRYIGSHRGPVSVPEGPCSFLEFLIGVSILLEQKLIDGREIPISDYFWELASRLRLTEFTDDEYRFDSTPFKVDDIMIEFMDRRYCTDGAGGLFPLRHPHRNQRRVEIWYQLNSYLLENPEFFDRRQRIRG